MADVDRADQARREIRDMIDATLSMVIREHSVDQAFVIHEIKSHLGKLENKPPQKDWFQKIKYTSKNIFSDQSTK